MKRLYFIPILLFNSFLGFSQYDIDKISTDSTQKEGLNFFEIKQRMYVGSELSLSFGTGGSYIYVAPFVGYDITERWSAGLSAMYQFSQVNYYNAIYRTNAFGGGVFTRLMPIEQLIIHAEYNLFNTEDYTTFEKDRVNVPAFMAGLGYAQQMGNGSYTQILLLYDFINDYNMPLPPFIIRNLHLKFGFVWHLN